jgi:hypothetical protein
MTTPGLDRPALSRVQNWFMAAITHADGVREGVTSAGAQEHIPLLAGEEEHVLTRSKALSALDRLAIYGYAYFARLLDCLREEYPVLKKALGDELFDAFAAGYLQQYPSRSYTLFDLGTQFPHFLRDTRPALDAADSGADWADFIIDLATLELAFNEVFDGPGVEGEHLLDQSAITAVPPERLPDSRLIPAPCLRVLAFRFPVHQYLTAIRRDEEPIIPNPAETFLAITRKDFIVRHFELSAPSYAVLSAILNGRTLGEALCEGVSRSDAGDIEETLAGWFFDWAAQGFFVGIVPASEEVASG